MFSPLLLIYRGYSCYRKVLNGCKACFSSPPPPAITSHPESKLNFLSPFISVAPSSSDLQARPARLSAPALSKARNHLAATTSLSSPSLHPQSSLKLAAGTVPTTTSRWADRGDKPATENASSCFLPPSPFSIHQQNFTRAISKDGP